MGLQSQLNDVASDSLPFFLLSIVFATISRLRSTFLPSSAAPPPSSAAVLDFSAAFSDDDDDALAEEEKEKCVFCLSGLKEGDSVRKLTCRHVFHTHCLDGWICQMKFSCPLCRSPLNSDWRVARLHRRVGSYLSSWFAVR